MIIRTLVFFLALVFSAPAIASGSDGGDHGAGGHHAAELNWADFGHWFGDGENTTAPLVSLFFNFALLAVIVYIVLRRPLTAKFRGRRESHEREFGEAQQLKEAAEKALAEARARIEELDDEIARLRQDVIDAGKAESARIVGDAEQRAERLRSDAAAIVEAEVARMTQAIREETVIAVVAEAERLLRGELGQADYDRLSTEYLESFGDGAPPRTGGN